ncbi:MAG TPA: anti-sigma factor [Actinoplanes sp.]
MNDIHSLVGAYALDALDDVERAAFARHLTECPACAQDAAELAEAAARLADATWSVPPPRMRTEVMTRIGRTRQQPPGSARGRQVRQAPRWRRLAAGAVAAGFLASGAAVATYAVQEQRVRDARIAAAAEQGDAERIQAVLAAPDAALRQGALTGGGRVTVVSSATTDAGVVLLAGAAPVPADRVYQLWLLGGATPRPAGVLGATGGGTVLIKGVRGMDAVAVTVEPAVGSTTPTLPTVVRVPLA